VECGSNGECVPIGVEEELEWFECEFELEVGEEGGWMGGMGLVGCCMAVLIGDEGGLGGGDMEVCGSIDMPKKLSTVGMEGCELGGE
jgi:hypothetical protein